VQARLLGQALSACLGDERELAGALGSHPARVRHVVAGRCLASQAELVEACTLLVRARRGGGPRARWAHALPWVQRA
jgi:hypothetical protein